VSKLTDRVLPALNWCHPFHWCPTDSWLRAEKYGRHNEAVQAYLATITFVDDCIGVLLDGLRCSRLRGRLRVLETIRLSDFALQANRRHRFFRVVEWILVR